MCNTALTAVVWRVKDYECQVQSTALQFHATRWLCMYGVALLTFDCHIIYCGEIKDIGEWHHIRSSLVQSLGRAAGHIHGIWFRGEKKEGKRSPAIYHKEKESKTAIKKQEIEIGTQTVWTRERDGRRNGGWHVTNKSLISEILLSWFMSEPVESTVMTYATPRLRKTSS